MEVVALCVALGGGLSCLRGMRLTEWRRSWSNVLKCPVGHWVETILLNIVVLFFAIRSKI
jgi:hypothetical protein